MDCNKTCIADIEDPGGRSLRGRRERLGGWGSGVGPGNVDSPST